MGRLRCTASMLACAIVLGVHPAAAADPEGSSSASQGLNPPTLREPSLWALSQRLGTGGSNVVYEAISAHAASCMEEQGFVLPPAPSPPFEITQEDLYRRYALDPSLVTPPLAAGPDDDDRGSPVDEYLLTLSDQEQRAWLAAMQGCRPHAERAIYGNRNARTALVVPSLQLAHVARRRAHKSPAVKRAERRWVRCMSGRGFMTRPGIAPADQSSPVEGGTGRLRRIAKAECNLESALAMMWNHAELAAERLLMAEHEGTILAIQEQLDREDRRARRYLAEES